MTSTTGLDKTKRPILVGADVGDASDEAIRQGDARARSTNTPLIVCHVLADPVQINPLFSLAALPIDVDTTRREVHDRLRERVLKLTNRENNDETVAIRVLRGVPYETIVAEAERVSASLVIVGSHGRTGVARALLGSVAERTVRYAPCPVLVARPRTLNGTILVASDFSDPSVPAIRAAADEAKRIGGRIVAVHAVDLTELDWTSSISGPAQAVVSNLAIEEMHRSAEAQLAAALLQVGATGECKVLEGKPGKMIVAAAEELDAELIIVGTSGRTNIARVVLGSVAESVVRQATRSVLVVRLGAAFDG